jgi:acetyl-CoA acetyltransferase
MRDAYIGGVGMTPFGRFAGQTVRSLATHAVEAALADAGVSIGDVEIAFFANAADGLLTGQEPISGQVALRDTGLLGIPIVNVENSCASAVHLAVTAVASGSCDVALAVGAEKISNEDRAETGTLFMDVHADLARRYMERSGATERDFAEVAAKNRRHGAANPDAQFRAAVTAEEVLESRVISRPLRLLMCSPIGDGAAAVIVSSSGAVRIRATALVSGAGNSDSPPARAARHAYERAGIGPEDVDVLEVHDAAAPAELICYEELGLCHDGDAPQLLASGATALGGRRPVNPSGGLVARGHPIGATGCAQLVELTRQLRGRAGARQVEGARVGLAENAGGFLGSGPAAAVVTILSRD